MPNANLQRDIVSIAKAEEISFVDLKVIHERHGVVRRLLEAERQSAMSAVRPCPCCSTAMICRVLAKDGRIFPNVVSIVDPSP